MAISPKNVKADTSETNQRLECQHSNQINTLCDKCSQNLKKINDLKFQFEKIYTTIESNQKKIDFSFNNGEYLIKEHCQELRRQVQLTKEIKIQKIEEQSQESIKKIDEYEKNSLIHYFKHQKQDQVYQDQLVELKTESKKFKNLLAHSKMNNFTQTLIEDLKCFKSKVEIKLEKLKHLIFENEQILEFKQSHTKDIQLGCFKSNSIDSIDFNQLYRVDTSKNFYKFVLEKIQCHLDEADEETYFYIIDTKFIRNNLIVLADFHYNHKAEIYLISVDDQGEWSHFNCINDIDHSFYCNNQLYTSINRICVSHYFLDTDLFIEIYDENLKRLNKIDIQNKRLIGATNDNIFILSNNKHEKSLFVFNWSLECIHSFGQNINSTEPFYFSLNCTQILSFDSNEIKFYFVRDLNEFHLINGLTGKLIRTIIENEVIKMSLDLNNNIIFFKENSLKFFNCYGYFLKDVYLINFVKNLGRECFYFSKNKFYYFDPYLYFLAID